MPFLLPFWVLAWFFAPPAAHATVATPAALSPQTPARPSLADCSAELNQTLQPTPAGAPADDAQAVWLNGSRLRWPGADAQAAVRLLRSARGQILALPGQAASGHDRALTLLPRQDLLPAAAQARFDWVGPGPEFVASAASRRELLAAHREQLVLVQEDAQGRVLRATTVQNAGALDALFAAATQVPDLGAWVAPASAPPRTQFKLWAPTAQNVALCLHSPRAAPNSSAAAAQPPAVQLLPLRRQTSTGVWLATQAADLSGHTYT